MSLTSYYAKPRMLEVFSGSQNFSRVAERLGFDVTTLDIDPSTSPTICVDILDFNYKDNRHGVFDFIHASPPCEEFSICKTRSQRNMSKAREIGQKTREIINYHLKLNPNCLFTIENPESSLIRFENEIIGGLKVSKASYCCYGYPYRKNTSFWNNFHSLILKECPRSCFWNKQHPLNVQIAPQHMRAQIPHCLCFEILLSASQQSKGRWGFKFRCDLFIVPSDTIKKNKNESSLLHANNEYEDNEQQASKDNLEISTASKKPGKKRGPKCIVAPEDIYCSQCGTSSSKRYYHVSKSTPTLCVSCYVKKMKKK